MQLLDEHITENIVKVGLEPADVRTTDRACALDWGSILSASCWDPARISLVLVTMFLLLWGSGTPQI